MTPVIKADVFEAIKRLPADLQEVADIAWRRVSDRVETGSGKWPAGAADNYARMLACSDYAASASLRQWPWFNDALIENGFARPPEPGLLIAGSVDDEAAVKKQLREYRHRQMLHILWRTYAGTAPLQETLDSLSALADELLIASHDIASTALQQKHGVPLAGGEEVALVILAMGKLGGHELNLSSDIDIIFLYTVDGETNGVRPLSAHEYFTRLARRIVNLLDDVTEDGFVFRVDTRLRPFGDSGPPVVSFSSLESYLLRHGRAWERYAYVKARVVGATGDDCLIAELLDETIRPFVYRRYLDYGVFESLREMKSLIASEVNRRELASNIKLGPGGIREIEFIVQSLQLVRGGANDSLRRQDLAGALQELVRGQTLPRAAGDSLSDAYRFLRSLENYLQALRDQQTHDLPKSEADRCRVAFAMRCDNWDSLVAELDRHRARVSERFREIAFRADSDTEKSTQDNRFARAWESAADPATWAGLFNESGFPDSSGLAGEIAASRRRIRRQKLGASARKRLARFIPLLLTSLGERRSPTETLGRVLRIVENIVRRSAYLALLNENPVVLRRLIDLCEQSAYFAGEIGRFPLLLDEMLDPRLFSYAVSADDMREDLEQRLQQVELYDSERQVEVLAQYQRATLFRIAIAEFSGKLPVMKVSDALTELAELILGHALSVAWADLLAKHGEPEFELEGVRHRAGFGVIAYGKLGGMELSYGSDLDLVFLHDSRGESQQTNGSNTLGNSMFFARLVRRLVHFLTTQTVSGALYDVDTRLRPSGRSGLLVTSVEAFERYQIENAWTWEQQALLRSRPVAGSVRVNREFGRIRTETLRTRVDRRRLAHDVSSMRAKMQRQLDQSTSDRFDLKQGRGGLGELEFLVQYLALANAHEHAATVFYPDNIRQLATLAATDSLSETEVSRLQEIYRDYRVRLHRLALDRQPPLIDESEFQRERQFVSGLWQRELD